MAQVRELILPQYLFRYRPLAREGDTSAKSDTVLNREIAAITEPYIWCSNFRALNDPMEGVFAPTHRLRKHNRREKLERAIADGKSVVGIASFSDTNTSELMWAHYAAQSSGICIRYSPRKLLAALPEETLLVRVAYDEKPAYIAVSDLNDEQLATKKVLSQKKFNWAYEREWRLLSKLGKVPIADISVISRIYLGTRISDEHKRRLRRALSGTGVEIFETRVTGYTYMKRNLLRRSGKRKWTEA